MARKNHVMLAALIGSALIPLTEAHGQSVVVDGTTATSVTLGADGSVNVGIAPSDRSGVSMNRYDRFNVPKAGVELNNREARARTIVNEVTGPTGTAIEGELSVGGQRAHVIIANPNGVAVDGGSFSNTGQVVLGAGTISRNAREIAPGIFQDNVVLNTAPGGAVRVEGGGLSGQMEALHVLAEKVAVNGKLTAVSDDPLSQIAIIAGQSETEFDSAVVPGNLGQPWARSTVSGRAKSGTIFELGAAGGLYGNRIQVLVSDQGAGVRMLGEAAAARQDFVLTSTGDIVMDGASVKGATGVQLQGRKVTATDSAVHASEGPAALLASSDVALTRSQIEGPSAVLQSGGNVAMSAAEMVSTSGDLIVEAAGALSDQGGHWQSARHISVSTEGALSFDASTMAGGAGGVIALQTPLQFAARDSVIEGDLMVDIDAGSVALNGEDKQGVLRASRGALRVRAEGDVSNTGTLMQGNAAIDAEGVQGAVSVTAGGSYLAYSASSDRRAVVFGANDDVVIETGGEIVNQNARILANGDVTLKAAGDLSSNIDLPDGALTPLVLTGSSSRPLHWSLGILKKSKRSISYDYGTRTDPGLDSQIVASGGNVSITAGDMDVLGGHVTANTDEAGNGGRVNLDIATLDLSTVASGRVSVKRSCDPFCSYDIEGVGEDGIQLTGGQIYGQNGVAINATQNVTNAGGMIQSEGAVDIAAPEVILQAIVVPFAVRRPDGLYNFWRSDAGWIYLRDLFGGVIADSATITSDRPVVIEGGEIVANSVSVPGGMNVLREPGVVSPIFDDRIGWPHDLPPVKWE